MAHAFSLSDGTNTSNLNNGSTVQALRYPIQSPSPQQWAQTGTTGDWGNLPSEWANVTESFDLLLDFRSSTLAAMQTAAQGIVRLTNAAMQRQVTGVGPRVFLIAQLDGESEAWRSEILSARLTWEDAADQFGRKVMRGTLSLTRRYFWETNAETQLSMTSSATSPAATTVTLYSNDDATPSQTNYINIASNQVGGALPAPLRLRINNNTGGSLNWRNIHIANTVFCDPANFDPFLLGSEAESGATRTWGESTERLGWRWESAAGGGPLTDARLADLGGRYYRVLLARSSGDSNVYYRLIVELQPGTVPVEAYRGDLVPGGSSELIDLGAVPIPPAGYDLQSSGIALRVNVLKAGGGSVGVDFVQLTPAGYGLYRKWTQIGFATGNGDGIEDDGPEGRLYYTDGSLHYPVVRGQAAPIYVWPGVQNRLRVLIDEATGWTAGRQLTAQAWVRARRTDI